MHPRHPGAVAGAPSQQSSGPAEPRWAAMTAKIAGMAGICNKLTQKWQCNSGSQICTWDEAQVGPGGQEQSVAGSGSAGATAGAPARPGCLCCDVCLRRGRVFHTGVSWRPSGAMACHAAQRQGTRNAQRIAQHRRCHLQRPSPRSRSCALAASGLQSSTKLRPPPVLAPHPEPNPRRSPRAWSPRASFAASSYPPSPAPAA
jgi:hypothetical protein